MATYISVGGTIARRPSHIDKLSRRRTKKKKKRSERKIQMTCSYLFRACVLRFNDTSIKDADRELHCCGYYGGE